MSRPAPIVVAEPVLQADAVPPVEDPAAPKVGRWYWRTMQGDDGVPYRRLVCVTHVGSNYAAVDGPEMHATRIHEDEFHKECVLEPDPEAVIKSHVAQHEGVVHELMAEIKALTMRLAVTSAPGLSDGEAGALALYSGKDVEQYKTSLALAEKKTLPDLFEKIKRENEKLGLWLAAPIIPLQAQADAMKPLIGAVRERVFSVELYAGLVEDVVRVTDGEPAAATEKLHLFQRRAYMDEECLAQYETGGMEFKNLEAFDAWIARPANVARLLPFPRCLLAFQVRRKRKDREIHSLADYFRVVELEQLDKLTFLYIRNGQQLFRLATEIEFGADLFPDLTEDQLSGVLYAKRRFEWWEIIPERQWLDLREREDRHDRAHKEREAVTKKMSPKKAADYRQAHPLPDEDFFRWHSDRSSHYAPFNRTNVYYDDIAKHIHAEMTRHNHLVLVLQGLLDRSPVLHPHPPWQLWTAEGFASALDLHYDDKRALTPGDAPDFQAYRDRLAESIGTGTVTLGQQRVWHGRKKENHPYSDDGPGKFARVAAFSKRSAKATFRWTRERVLRAYDERPTTPIACRMQVKTSRLFNVDAYTPGDFKQFFGDPRTRADYLQWAPLLLEAEEYHAGNRGEPPAPIPPPPKRRVTPGGSYEYQKRKRLQALRGKAVRFARDLTTWGGTKYKRGSLWRVTFVERGTLHVIGIQPDGQLEPMQPDPDGEQVRRSMRCLLEGDLIVVPNIPVDPEFTPKPQPRTRDADEDDDD